MLAILHSVGMFVADDIQIWKGSNCFLTVADGVFYIQQGKIKLTVVSEQGVASRKPRSVDGQSNWRPGVRSHPATQARGGNAVGSEIHTTVETRRSELRTNPSTQCRRHDCVERSSSPATAAAFSWLCILPPWSARHRCQA